MSQMDHQRSRDSSFSVRANLRWMCVQRPSSFAQVDGLRALSVIWVILGHVYWIPGAMLSSRAFAPLVLNKWLASVWNADLGVDAFFVISGFLISGLIYDECEKRGAISLPLFYVRRGMRLLPALWVTLLVYWALGYPHMNYVWANLLYVNNFLPLGKQCMPWGWSLAIEEQFYFVFPVFFLMVYPVGERFWKRLLVILMVVGFAISLLMTYKIGATFPLSLSTWLNGAKRIGDWSRDFDHLIDKPHMQFGSFLFGIMVSYVIRKPNSLAFYERRRGLSWVIFGGALITALWIALWPCRHPDFTLGPTLNRVFMAWRKYLFSGSVALILLATFTEHPIGRFCRKALSLKEFYPVAQLSYSAYLLHPLVIVLVFDKIVLPPFISAWQLFYYFVLDLILILAASAILYMAVERPLMNMRPRSLRGIAAQKGPEGDGDPVTTEAVAVLAKAEDAVKEDQGRCKVMS